jgi:Family of unknown function (DUF5681)
MKFQPGQSGNPAGRPLGARNKKTIAREEELAKRAEKAVDRIIFFAGGGHAAAMRVCAEWLRPGGNSRALALELPRVTCADDAQAAFDMVIAEFGSGGITVRECRPCSARSTAWPASRSGSMRCASASTSAIPSSGYTASIRT